MWSLIFGLLTKLPGLAERFLDYQAKKLDRELEGFKTGAGVDLEAFKVHLAAQLENNRLRLAQQSWWGAKLIILTAGIPAAAHFGAVFLDTLIPPFGSWGIPKLPPPYDTYQWAIVQSFFLVMPAMAGVSAVSQWLNRR